MVLTLPVGLLGHLLDHLEQLVADGSSSFVMQVVSFADP